MSNKINLDAVKFRLKIEETFVIKGRGVVVATGRIEKGKIDDKASVSLITFDGHIIKEGKILDIDWFGRGKYEHVTAEFGRNIGILFELSYKEYIFKGNYIVII